MKKSIMLVFATIAIDSWAWNALSEMEEAICVAVTNDAQLLNASFTNQLVSASTNRTSSAMRCEAYMLLSICAYQHYLDTQESAYLADESRCASNAVVTAGNDRTSWRYWMARVAFASSFVSRSEYGEVCSLMQNSLVQYASSGYTNEMSQVEKAILTRFEMDGLDLPGAMRVMAGMSAASLGNKDAARQYANQVPDKYKRIMLEFIND